MLNDMAVKISDSEFKELMRTLDPGSTGWVNVSTFVELLEEKPRVSVTAMSPLRFHLWQGT